MKNFVFSPEVIASLKASQEAQKAQDEMFREKANVKTVAGGYAYSLRKTAKTNVVPLQQASQGEMGWQILADTLSQLTSTLPESQREYKSGLGTLRGIRLEDQQRLQQEENLRAQNEQRALEANARAEEARYNASVEGLRSSERGLDRATQDKQFTMSQGQQASQFNRTEGRLKAAQAFDEQYAKDRLGLDKDQFAELKRHNQQMEVPEFQRTIEGLVASGLSTEEATNMVLTPMKDAYTEYKRKLEVYKTITPAKLAERQLKEWADADYKFTLETANIKAATAAHNRANRPSLAQDPNIAGQNKEDAASIANNRKAILDATNRINGILAEPNNYEKGKLKQGAINAINKLKGQGAALNKTNGTLRGNMAGRGMAPQDIDSIIGELERAFAEGGD